MSHPGARIPQSQVHSEGLRRRGREGLALAQIGSSPYCRRESEDVLVRGVADLLGCVRKWERLEMCGRALMVTDPWVGFCPQTENCHRRCHQLGDRSSPTQGVPWAESGLFQCCDQDPYRGDKEVTWKMAQSHRGQWPQKEPCPSLLDLGLLPSEL